MTKVDKQRILDDRTFRNIVGNFTTGVTVITTKDGNKPVGFTANSFTSLSLNPKLVLFCLDKKASSYQTFMEAEHFAINILASDQIDISKQFATSGIDRFQGIVYKEAVTGSPILKGVLAYIDCKLDKRVDGGDHTIFIGEVLAGDEDLSKQPLIFYQGKYLE